MSVEAEGQHELREALERHLEGSWTWITLYDHLRLTHHRPSLELVDLGHNLADLDGAHRNAHGVSP